MVEKNDDIFNWAMEQTDTGLWRLDMKENLLWWSDVTYKIHEVEVGKPVNVDEAIHYYIEEHRPIIEKLVKDSSATGDPYDVELQIETTDGKRKWVRAIGKAIKNGNDVLRLEGAFIDINERKRGEIELQNTLLGLASFDNALTQHMIVTRTDSKGKITFANKGFCKISGFELNEVLGHSHNLVRSSYHSTEFWEKFWKTILERKPWKGEIKNKSKSGHFYWVDTMVIPMADSEGKISEIISLGTEVTEKKERETRVNESEKLALVGETTAQIFHDVMNPLTIILLSAQKIKKKAPEDFDLKPIETIITSVQRVQEMFGEVRDLLHQGEEEHKNVQQIANLKHVVDKALELVCLKLEQNDVRVESPTIESDINLFGSELQFTQVVINVINNAVDAIKDLEDKWINIKVATIGKYVHLAITDSGEGIPEDIQQKIFKNLFSTKKKEGGTGLGLGICRKILRRYGGDININTKSQNTSFLISFKLH